MATIRAICASRTYPARAAIPRHGDGYYDLYALQKHLEHRIAQVRASTSEPEELERRLTELGIAEANYHGWNDTYTFTKWMGEQLAMRAMRGRSLTIVRPSIIESTLAEPVPGWIEGVKVADAIILAYARGKTSFFPAKPMKWSTSYRPTWWPTACCWRRRSPAGSAGYAHLPGLHGVDQPITVGRVIALIQGESQRNWRSMNACSTVSRNTISVWSAAPCFC
jgi:hypothetical protein